LREDVKNKDPPAPPGETLVWRLASSPVPFLVGRPMECLVRISFD
jgi:hypothetical protein